MAFFLGRLFRRRGREAAAEEVMPVEPVPSPVAIPVPDGMPPELLDRVPALQPRDQGRRRKRRTPEGKAADHEAWLGLTLRQNRVRFEFDWGRAEAIGITHYRWRSARDGDVCEVCRARDGMRFALRGTDDFDHPGLMPCVCKSADGDDEAAQQPCRCYAEMIVPK